MALDILVAGRFGSPDGTLRILGNVSETHSRRMGAIRGKGNRTTEVRFRAMLVRAGIRGWTMQTKGIKGKPDFYFPDNKVAVFLDGCFWHGCPQCGHVPRVNRPFWKAKIERNQRRDRETNELLLQTGIQAVRFWEHELCNSPKECLQRLRERLEWP
ncbi:MAG TPA: very short patch repair endonuclease [Gemmataceae bacterium]|jgi:DNA mismatch endonuclease (patch repair protein)